MTRKPDPLPDPWLFDSEALLRELDRCRETVLQIPITNPNATHFGIQLAVNAIYNLSENLRYILHLHREQQRAIRKQHEESLSTALAENAKANIVHLHTPTPGNGKARQHHHDRQHSARENCRRRRTFSQPAA
jgi:hypothetical protein